MDEHVVAGYVTAAAQVLELPLDDERRAAVVNVMHGLAAFARDVAAAELGDDVEVAGVFIP